MIDRQTAKILIRNRKIMDFVWHWITKPLYLFMFLLTLIKILIDL